MTSTSAPTPRPRRRLRRIIIAFAATVVVAVGGTAAWALDRFVIDHVEITSVSAYEAEVLASRSAEVPPEAGTTEVTAEATSTEADTSGASTDSTVTDGTATADTTSTAPQITIDTVVTGTGDSQVTYYVADVVVSDVTQLRSAFAEDSFGTNIIENPSDIAASVDATLAINGDYYGFRDTGIVIRNGVVYRDEPARTGLAIMNDGTLQIYDETTTTADALVAEGVWQTLSFGPALVDDGQIVDGIDDVEVDTNFGNHSIQGQQPRTAMGMIEANHFVFVVVDGRSDESAGVTLTGLAQIMQSLGATEAYNLDGGGSSTMVSDGQLVNDPLGKGEERGTSDILYVAA